jgi:hypothetical protein
MLLSVLQTPPSAPPANTQAPRGTNQAA